MSVGVPRLNESRLLRPPAVANGALPATVSSHVLMEVWPAVLCVVYSYRDFSAAICAIGPIAHPWRRSCIVLRHGVVDHADAEVKLMRPVWSLYADEMGASMAEYAMLLALIAVSTLAAIQALRDQIDLVFASTASALGTVDQ